MDADEIARLKRLEQTVDHCKKENEAYASLPGFPEVVNTLDTKLNGIHAIEQEITTQEQEFTTAKNSAKGVMVEHTDDNSASVRAYAGQNHDFEIPSAVKLSKAALLRQRDLVVADTCNSVLSICIGIGPALAPFRFTDEKRKATEAAIKDYKDKLVKSPEYVSFRKAMNKKCSVELDAAEAYATASLDTLVELIRKDNPLMYNQYMNLRKGSRPGGRTISLRGKVLDSGTKKGLRGVQATLTRTAFADGSKATGDDVVSYTKLTTKMGTLQMKSMPDGTYTITFIKAGYAVQTITVYVNDNEMTTFEVLLVKL